MVESRGHGDGNGYLTTLIDYVHLNPARAGLVSASRGESLLDYPWSSVARGHALAPRQRPSWLTTEPCLSMFGYRDRAAERRRFVERLDAWMASEEAERCGLAEPEGQPLRSTLRRGWYWGSEAFRESLLARLESTTGGSLPAAKDFRSGVQAKDYAMRDAEAIVAAAVKHFEMDAGSPDDFASLPRGDLRRVAVAWAITRNTSLPQRWIAERLAMRTAGNVSEQVRAFAKRPTRGLPKDVRAWRKERQ